MIAFFFQRCQIKFGTVDALYVITIFFQPVDPTVVFIFAYKMKLLIH